MYRLISAGGGSKTLIIDSNKVSGSDGFVIFLSVLVKHLVS